MAEKENKLIPPQELRAEMVTLENEETKVIRKEVALVCGDNIILISKANAQALCLQLNDIVKLLVKDN